MTIIERTTKSANSLADQAVSTVSQVGTAIAEGIVVTGKDLRSGLKTGHIRPRTVLAAAAIGLIAVVEWPVLVVVGGGAFVASKLKKKPTEDTDATESPAESDADAVEPDADATEPEQPTD